MLAVIFMSAMTIALPEVQYTDSKVPIDRLHVDQEKIDKYRANTTHLPAFSQEHPADFWHPKASTPYTIDRSAKDIRVINELRRQPN